MPDTFRPLGDEKPKMALRDEELDIALRDGLRRLPTPAVSADFDARVLAALAVPPSTWEGLRIQVVSTLRPLLCGTACSLGVTLLALFWTLHMPAAVPALPNAPSSARPLDMAALDSLLSQPRLGASSLTVWARQSAVPIATLAPPPIPSDPERRPRAEHRRACRPFPTLLTA